MHYVTLQGEYYFGKKENPIDIEVPRKPNFYFDWDFQNSTWKCNSERHWSWIREERNKLLSECDWTQLLDSPISEDLKLSYQSYRQELRDLPETSDNCCEVVFPELPEA